MGSERLPSACYSIPFYSTSNGYNYKHSNKADGYNDKLGPNRICCVILQRKGKVLYELGNAVGKSVGVFHAKHLYVD